MVCPLTEQRTVTGCAMLLPLFLTKTSIPISLPSVMDEVPVHSDPDAGTT